MSRRVTPLVALIVVPVAPRSPAGSAWQTGDVRRHRHPADRAGGGDVRLRHSLLRHHHRRRHARSDHRGDPARRRRAADSRRRRARRCSRCSSHLDGSGAVTFLVTIPAMLPLYDRLGIDRRVLACVVSHGGGRELPAVDRPDDPRVGGAAHSGRARCSGRWCRCRSSASRSSSGSPGSWAAATSGDSRRRADGSRPGSHRASLTGGGPRRCGGRGCSGSTCC